MDSYQPMENDSSVIELVGTIVTLLLIAVGISALAKRVKLPFTVALVLVGIGLRQLSDHGPEFLGQFITHEISPHVIMFVFLPTLIFESAFNLDVRQLRSNLLAVLVLAIPGLLLSTAIIGVMVWLLTPFDLASSLLLGSILSATDPVAVIAIFRHLGVPERLTILVEGESLLNDATAIIIARGVIRVSRVREGAEHDMASLTAGDFFGEIALQHNEPRTVTCRAVTPAAICELKRRDLNDVIGLCPGLKTALIEADQDRRKLLAEHDREQNPETGSN
jgi:NhaP-type Na+/H+ or K+/H+ antiporter